MELKSDARGLFIEGMTDSTELSSYLQRKFKDEDIQNTYESLTKNHIKTARSQDITPLSKFWQTLDESYKKIPPLKCDKGCAHCCHTGVAATKVEWDGILNNILKNNHITQCVALTHVSDCFVYFFQRVTSRNQFIQFESILLIQRDVPRNIG